MLSVALIKAPPIRRWRRDAWANWPDREGSTRASRAVSGARLCRGGLSVLVLTFIWARIFTKYRIYVRILIEQAAIGRRGLRFQGAYRVDRLALLPAYWYFWKRPGSNTIPAQMVPWCLRRMLVLFTSAV
jgi:hypothetical protein